MSNVTNINTHKDFNPVYSGPRINRTAQDVMNATYRNMVDSAKLAGSFAFEIQRRNNLRAAMMSEYASGAITFDEYHNMLEKIK